VSRRNRSNRRRTYGKRQHEVRERRPGESRETDWSRNGDAWIAPDVLDDGVQHDGAYDAAYDAEGWAR
jgi:hypothetical protein